MSAGDKSASAASADCPGECTATQVQATSYMNNELLWAQLIVAAWTDNELFEAMQELASKGLNANELLTREAANRGLPAPTFPEGVETRIVIDQPQLVHLILPAPENIPARSVAMVPHAL